MLDIQNYASFIIAIIIFQIVPGAGTIVILNATARKGIKVGIATVLGTILGDFIFMVAAMAGLATIMNANPVLFKALQWFGAAYLCWIGIQLMLSKVDKAPKQDGIPSSSWTYFRQAFAVSLTNPKVILFFVSFFPLFLKPDSSPETLLVMMIHVTIISLVYQVGLVFIGNTVTQKLKALPFAHKVVSRLAGIALIGFGIKLAINNR